MATAGTVISEEEQTKRLISLTLVRLREFMSLYPEYKFVLFADSQTGDAQLMLTSVYAELQAREGEGKPPAAGQGPPGEAADVGEKEKKQADDGADRKPKGKDKERKRSKKEIAKEKSLATHLGLLSNWEDQTKLGVRKVFVREVGGKPFSPLYKQIRTIMKQRAHEMAKGKLRMTKEEQRLPVQGFKTFVGAALRAFNENLLKIEGQDTLLVVSRAAVEEMQRVSFQGHADGDAKAMRMWDELQHDLEEVKAELKKSAGKKRVRVPPRASVHRDLNASISSLSILSYQLDNEDEAKQKELTGLISQTTKEQAPLLLSEEGIQVLKLFQKFKASQEKEKDKEKGAEKETPSAVRRRKSEDEDEDEGAVGAEAFSRLQEAKTMEELLALLTQHSTTQILGTMLNK